RVGGHADHQRFVVVRIVKRVDECAAGAADLDLQIAITWQSLSSAGKRRNLLEKSFEAIRSDLGPAEFVPVFVSWKWIEGLRQIDRTRIDVQIANKGRSAAQRRGDQA